MNNNRRELALILVGLIVIGLVAYVLRDHIPVGIVPAI